MLQEPKSPANPIEADHVLATADLSAAVSEGQRRRIIGMVVQAIMSSSVGTKIDRSKLELLLNSTFSRLCDGFHFDSEPLVKALLRAKGVTEEGLFIALTNLGTLLETMKIRFEAPPLGLSKAVRVRLLEEAERAADDARFAHQASLERRKRGKDRLRLGDLLVAEGHLLPHELEIALDFQRRFGGRIGSNLVQLGLISEESLAKFLSVQLGLPCCLSEKEFNAIPQEVIALVPRDLAETHRIVPLSVDKQRLRLAVVEPDLSVIDELAFRSAHRIIPVVAPEFLISYGLEKHYAIPRVVTLLRARTEDERSVRGGDPSAGMDMTLEPARSTRPKRAIREEEEVDEMATQLLEVGGKLWPEGGPAAPAPPQAAVVHPGLVGAPLIRVDMMPLAEALIRAGEENELYDAVLEHLSVSFEEAAVFAIQGSEAHGVQRASSQTTTKVFRSAAVPISGGGFGAFSQVISTRRLFLAALIPSDENDELLAALELPPGSTVSCLPLTDLGGVSGFLVMSGLRQGIQPPEPQELERLGGMLNAGLRMVGLRKQIIKAAQRAAG